MKIEDILDSEQVKQKLNRIEKDLPDIKKELEQIYQKNENNSLNDCKDRIVMEIEKADCDIYRVSSRIKDSKSLIKKIINKLYEGKKTYKGIDVNNYNKIITDLIGIRIVHKFPDDWYVINKFIFDNFFISEDAFVSNYLEEYCSDPSEPFLVQPPTVYHLPDEDLSIYQEFEKQLDKKIFDYKPRENYRSVHYIINYQGAYCEIQVRTLSDELWGEIEHDFVYKQEISTKKDRLTDAAALLRNILSASDAVGMYMKKIIDDDEDLASYYWMLCQNKIDDAKKILNRKVTEK